MFTINTGSTPPALPSLPKATSTANSITLTWKAAKGDTAFLILGEVDNASETTLPRQLVKGGTATITGLAPSTYYKIQVAPLSAGGVNHQAPFIYVSTTK